MRYIVTHLFISCLLISTITSTVVASGDDIDELFIQGIVTHEEDNVVGAIVTMMNRETGESISTSTDQNGQYEIWDSDFAFGLSYDDMVTVNVEYQNGFAVNHQIKYCKFRSLYTNFLTHSGNNNNNTVAIAGWSNNQTTNDSFDNYTVWAEFLDNTAQNQPSIQHWTVTAGQDMVVLLNYLHYDSWPIPCDAGVSLAIVINFEVRDAATGGSIIDNETATLTPSTRFGPTCVVANDGGDSVRSDPTLELTIPSPTFLESNVKTVYFSVSTFLDGIMFETSSGNNTVFDSTHSEQIDPDPEEVVYPINQVIITWT